jgi:transposase
VAAHVRCFDFLGGVPALLIPDNLHSAVTKANRYEADLNRTYEDLADHYGCAVIPARPRKPRDKAKAESGVQVAQRWILAALAQPDVLLARRGERCDPRTTRLAQPGRSASSKAAGASLFESLDKPALRSLPERPFESGVWRKGQVNIDYHVEVDRHYYSVPYQLGETADIRISASVVEFFVRGRRVASHVRSAERYKATTIALSICPRRTVAICKWTPGRHHGLGEQRPDRRPDGWSLELMARKPHPEQGYRSVWESCVSGVAMEPSASRPPAREPWSSTPRRIPQRRLDPARGARSPTLPEPSPTLGLPRRDHANVRGPAYYE